MPVSRIELDPTGEYRVKKKCLRYLKNGTTRDWRVRTTEDESDKLETPSADEEIMIPSQNSADIRNVDIRDEQSENTQREDWLLPTEPRHGARPRQTGGERPPAMEDSVLRDAVDVSAVLHTSEGGGGGRLAPEPQDVQKEARAVPKIFPEDTKRHGGQGQKNVGSPIDTLVNTCRETWPYSGTKIAH